MTEVYLVCSNVDLGYHVEYAYLNEYSAAQKVNEMNVEYAKLKIDDLMKCCKYSKEDAVNWVQTNNDDYFLQVVNLIKE